MYISVTRGRMYFVKNRMRDIENDNAFLLLLGRRRFCVVICSTCIETQRNVKIFWSFGCFSFFAHADRPIIKYLS